MDLNIKQKIVTDNKNTFFTANKFMTGSAIPTEGEFAKGDIIVNIGENAFEEPMWICVEAGSPGVWEIVGAGAGGSNGNMKSFRNQVIVSNEISEVEIGINGFSKETDTLMVFINSVFATEGEEYVINDDSTKITFAGNGRWNSELLDDFTFEFVVFKMVEDNGYISPGSELISLKSHKVVSGVVNEVEIGIEGFNKETDMLSVYRNSTFMIEDVDYRISDDSKKIICLNGNWNESGSSNCVFGFVVLKTVGKINPDAVVGMEHLTEDVKQAIEAAGNIDMSKYDTKLEELEARVEEAFTSANNGKQLIANAIGEPVSADDTFQAMSDDINGLLSQFKTNMMNNGVAVESGDKFKQLIDKIATMIEEGGNKGIQFANGEINSINNNTYMNFDGLYSGYVYGSGWNTCNYIELGLNFVPTIILVQTTMVTTGSSPFTVYSSTIYDNFSKGGTVCKSEFTCTSSTNNDGSMLHFSPKIENGNYILPIRRYNSTYPIGTIQCTWLAIGVGEEDTTLRDSLASILQEEGVSVTDEDDMAGLIIKVDDEFDRKNNALANSSLNIISASELPVSGDENQICIITNTTPSNYVITSNYNDKSTNTNVITMYTSNTASNDATEGTLVHITSGNLTTNYYFSKICQGDNRLASYIYKSGAWKQLTQNYVWFLEKGSYVNESYHGGISTGGYVQYYPTEAITVAYSSYYHAVSSFANPINLSLYKKIKCIAYLDYPNGNKTFYITLHPNRQTQTAYSNDITTSTTNIYKVADLMTNGTPKVYEMDVSSVTGEYYIGFGAYTGLNGNTFITDIWLE